MHCKHHSSSPSGHLKGWPPKPRQETWSRLLAPWTSLVPPREVGCVRYAPTSEPHCVPPAAFRQTQTWPCGAGLSMGIPRPRSHPLDDDVDKDAAVQGPQHFHPDATHSTHSEKPEGSMYVT